MCRFTPFAFAAAFLFGLALPLAAQPAPERVELPGEGPPHIPPVTYTIRAVVTPESLLVRGTIDIEYRNTSFDTIPLVYFALDLNDTSFVRDSSGGPYCHIDSILYRGTPSHRH